ncbi:MAG TPA: cyclodeaminase/cyclohydrolase family protein [Thermoplasmata archaeon]|nr:cyclodeaminase/cyclohydrolase family protein [Thermoplasmata archaeon]
MAARTPTPGGGSAAAGTSAMGVALGEMVFAYSMSGTAPSGLLAEPKNELTKVRARLVELVTEDTAAYDRVRDAQRARRASPGEASAQRSWEAAVRAAAEVPLETATASARAIALLESHRGEVKATFASDLVTALALLRAGKEGAVANVATNLEDLQQAGLPVGDLVAGLERLRTERP